MQATRKDAIVSLSRWHRIFTAALERRPVVGVQTAVFDHLGRVASHSEANAARRAAHSYAAAGHAVLERAPVTTGGQRDRLVLVRNGLEATPELLAEALLPGPPIVSLTARAMHTEAARRLVGTVREAAMQSRHVQADKLDQPDRAALADALSAALSDLARFRRQLNRPSRPSR